MTGGDTDVPAAVALELERLRGTVEAGFTRVDGSLALVVQRNDQIEKQLDEHETRLDSLERARWPLASMTALAAVSGLALTVYQLTGQ